MPTPTWDFRALCVITRVASTQSSVQRVPAGYTVSACRWHRIRCGDFRQQIHLLCAVWITHAASAAGKMGRTAGVVLWSPYTAGAVGVVFRRTPLLGVLRPCMQYAAGAASMDGAWFIHWPERVTPERPVRGLYGPLKSLESKGMSHKD